MQRWWNEFFPVEFFETNELFFLCLWGAVGSWQPELTRGALGPALPNQILLGNRFIAVHVTSWLSAGTSQPIGARFIDPQKNLGLISADWLSMCTTVNWPILSALKAHAPFQKVQVARTLGCVVAFAGAACFIYSYSSLNSSHAIIRITPKHFVNVKPARHQVGAIIVMSQDMESRCSSSLFSTAIGIMRND